MGEFMEKQIIDAILRHLSISENHNKTIRIKISTLRKYLKKQYYIQLDQSEIIKVIENNLSDQFTVDKKSKPVLMNEKTLIEVNRKIYEIDRIQKIYILDNCKGCPICKTQFKNKIVELAYYLSEPCMENLLRYIKIQSLYCSKCQKYFISKKYYKQLKREHLGHVINGIDFSKIKSAYTKSTYTIYKGAESNTNGNRGNTANNMILDKINVIFDCQKRCFCGKDLENKVVSIKSSSGYNSYIDCKGLYCSKCSKYYITKSEYETNKYWINTKAEFYIPKEKISVEKFFHLCNRKYEQLNEESFLYILGYNVSDNKLSLKERLNILDYAVLVFGKGKVMTHIEYLINDRSNQINGLIRYQNALMVWKHDLEYLKKKI